MVRRALGAVVAVLLLACSHGAPRPDARVVGWHEDLRGLLPSLVPVHPDLANGAPAALRSDVESLAAQASALDDDALMVGVMRVVARIAPHGDGHTGLYVWSNGNRPVHALPLRLWFFSDGLYVEDALGPAHDLAGARITGINGHPLDEVLRAIDPLVPTETVSTRPLLRPRFLLVPEVLHGLGLVPRVDEVALDVAGRGSVRVRSVPMADYDAWAGGYGLHLVARPGARWLTRTDETLWHAVDGRVLYVAYNAVAEHLDAAELAEVGRLARTAAIDRVVVDVRHNTGGEVGADRPLLDVLSHPLVARRGRLFLLTGRNTFSAAGLFVAALRTRTPVTVVGEAASSGARSYGNPTEVTLPHSGLALTVAATREAAGAAATPVAPDVPVALSYADYVAGRDPVYAAALR